MSTRPWNKPVPPCAAPGCGTLGGYVPPGKTRPARTTGATVGIDGPLCRRCYERLRHRAEAARRPAAQERAEAARRLALALEARDRDRAEISRRIALIDAARRLPESRMRGGHHHG